MKNYIVLLPFLLLLWSCKEKKTSLKDDEEVEVTDFIEFFPEVTLPFRVADTSLLRKQTDSSLIGYKVFTKFIPDSVLQQDFGKTGRPAIYPLGRVTEKNKDVYLFIKAVQGSKRVSYLACFDEDDKFLAIMPLVKTGFDSNTNSFGLLDKKFQITTYRERKKPGGESTYKKNVFIFNNSANNFMLILTEPNEEIIENVINPIDTLPKKHKFSGDYIVNKRNFISFRDGKNPTHLLFFVHFEKSNGECIGELKGAATLNPNGTAVFRESGNPCAVEFNFTTGAVSMNEVGGCGSYRDIKCFFEGKFPRKKEVKPKKK